MRGKPSKTGAATRRRRMSQGGDPPLVLAALPLAYREGMDEYDGIMRYLCENGLEWDLRVVRHSYDIDLFKKYPADRIAGAILGMDYRPGIVNYTPRIPDDVLKYFAENRVPVVTLDFPYKAVKARRGVRISSLEIDSEPIGRLAARHLAAAGEYLSFGFIGAFENSAWSRDRGAFFVKELRKLGRRPVSIFHGDASGGGGDLPRWLNGLRKPAAVFASNDFCGDLVLKACMASRLRVPDDLAVLGVDDDPVFCIHATPTLSSIHPDFEAEGYEAAKAMAEFIAGRTPPRRATVAGEIAVVRRMSTAPCAPSGRLVRKAEEIIARRACTGLTAEILAGTLNISRRLLDMRYRQIHGISVRKAIEKRRLERACELLVGTNHSHKMIAKSCGFSSESYLEHVFSVRLGVSMRAYRFKFRKTPPPNSLPDQDNS